MNGMIYDIPLPDTAPPSYLEHFVDLNHEEADKVKRQAFWYMNQFEGWCSEEKASILIDLVLQHKPERIVEVGVFGGKSLIPMACALRANGKGKIYGIDAWDPTVSVLGMLDDKNISWWGSINHDALFRRLQYQVAAFDLDNHVMLLKATSLDVEPIYLIDILHIDANHSEEAAYFDVIKWVTVSNRGAFVIFNDIQWEENGVNTTAKAVEWLNTHCYQYKKYSDSCKWGIWIKP